MGTRFPCSLGGPSTPPPRTYKLLFPMQQEHVDRGGGDSPPPKRQGNLVPMKVGGGGSKPPSQSASGRHLGHMNWLDRAVQEVKGWGTSPNEHSTSESHSLVDRCLGDVPRLTPSSCTACSIALLSIGAASSENSDVMAYHATLAKTCDGCCSAVPQGLKTAELSCFWLIWHSCVA